MLELLQSQQFVAWSRTGGGIRLTAPRKTLASFTVDWELLERRRKGELSKLEAVQKYAYTKDCRRGYVLRYFGDPAATRKCTGCDNCLGTTASASAKPAKKKRVDAPRRSAPSASGSVSPHPRLLESLRALRLTIAREEKVPAYVIFPDRSLEAMAAHRPATLEALAQIHGVGQTRLEKYGSRFLAAVRNGS